VRLQNVYPFFQRISRHSYFTTLLMSIESWLIMYLQLFFLALHLLALINEQIQSNANT